MYGAQPAGVGANVLLTGANRGIGLGLVHVLVKAPGVKRIFAGCRKPEQAKELQELKKSSSALEIVQLDVTDDASVKKAFEHVSQAVGNEGLNLLINNSGILENTGTAIDNADRATYLRHFDVNAVSVAVVTSIFLPLLRKAASAGSPARIANISSTLGSVQLTENCLPLPSGDLNVVYGMSKAALNLYTRALAGNEKEKGIVVVCFCPGWVRTDMGSQQAQLSVEESTTALIDTISKLTLAHTGRYINRNGEPIPF